jgi:hypothetical protein
LSACSTLKSVDPFGRSAPPPPVVTKPAGPTPLMGMSADNLRMTIGAPAFVRKDGSDQLWRYDAANCKAFFFLYPRGAELAVRHIETLPRGADMPADPACLKTLRVMSSPPVS